jgi:hypothetical protein
MKGVTSQNVVASVETMSKRETMTTSYLMPLTFSANDLADYFGVDRQTIYRMHANGRLPPRFVLGRRIRRCSLTELIRHSDELQEALTPFLQKDAYPANDNMIS